MGPIVKPGSETSDHPFLRSQDRIQKFYYLVKQYWHDVFVLACVILIAIISYNLGQIKALQKTSLAITEGENIYLAGAAPQPSSAGANIANAAQPRDPRVVASKNSTAKRYYYSWCGSAKRIKPENQIWFENEAAAQKVGYTLAGNCQ